MTPPPGDSGNLPESSKATKDTAQTLQSALANMDATQRRLLSAQASMDPHTARVLRAAMDVLHRSDGSPPPQNVSNLTSDLSATRAAINTPESKAAMAKVAAAARAAPATKPPFKAAAKSQMPQKKYSQSKPKLPSHSSKKKKAPPPGSTGRSRSSSLRPLRSSPSPSVQSFASSPSPSAPAPHVMDFLNGATVWRIDEELHEHSKSSETREHKHLQQSAFGANSDNAGNDERTSSRHYLCVACQRKPSTVIWKPCHHCVMCSECARIYCPNFCSLCRAPITERCVPPRPPLYIKPRVFYWEKKLQLAENT